MEKRLSDLEQKVHDISVRMAIAESDIKNVKEDLDAIKSNTQWILRLVIGGLVIALLNWLIGGMQ